MSEMTSNVSKLDVKLHSPLLNSWHFAYDVKKSHIFVIFILSYFITSNTNSTQYAYFCPVVGRNFRLAEWSQ